MNRFRTKKKGRDDLGNPRPSVEHEPSGFSKMFGKGKKSYEEPKQEVDLAAALPASDDFRTSLLMTGLSARFSMLREQDDPNSKIGKASDDSVLFPKRQSRLDYGFRGGLHDIVEVESIRAPPFARYDSYNSDDAFSMSGGSIMARGKPTEGNNLFGGRQKIYKITANGPSKEGGLPGRALYEDDIAQSSFQRWRQAEKERRSLDDERDDFLDTDSAKDSFRRRETNSTTSSMARNSTAATSITSSQPAPSLQDWQPPSATLNGPERTVTRTRRLYEPGLTQDLQDHQSSALNRMDTLSKRSFGNRTPDLTPTMPSPTNNGFGDRPPERRQILSKASAPNLRSFSPTLMGSSQTSPAESTSKFPGFEQRSYNATPPLSPPISETEEHPMMAIGPNDRGKATAMGVFARPSQPYDESRYAQRQRQLQQGRDTPTNRTRTESNASLPTSRSRSSSSMHRAPSDRTEQFSPQTEPTVQEEVHAPFSNFAGIPEQPSRPPPLPNMARKRPDDLDHPALRSAIPTPLSVSSRNSLEALAATDSSKPGSRDDDSPTLGPPSGLNGMVRQHMRNVSNASSVYGPAPGDPEADGHPSNTDASAQIIRQLDFDTDEWTINEHDWTSSYAEEPEAPQAQYLTPPARSSRPASNEAPATGENDDFARHLADGARRVREKLGSYADPESDRSTPTGALFGEPTRDLAPSHSDALGLRPKSSRGSLADADAVRGAHGSAEYRPRSRKEVDTSTSSQPAAQDKDEKVHAGLKAFRQARRELQRMKEADVQQRRHKSSPSSGQGSPGPPSHDEPCSSPGRPSLGLASDVDYTPQDDEVRLSPLTYQPQGTNGANSFPRHAYGGQSPALPGMENKRPAVMPIGGPPAGPHRSGSSPFQSMARGYDSSQSSPHLTNGMSPASPNGLPAPRSRNGNQMGSATSTPNLSSGPSAPPLPPLNPRRRTGGSDSDSPITGTPPMGNADQRQSTFILPDEELGPEQFRQRLRKVPNEVNAMNSRGRGLRASPPRGSPRSNHASPGISNGAPGGMF